MANEESTTVEERVEALFTDGIEDDIAEPEAFDDKGVNDAPEETEEVEEETEESEVDEPVVEGDDAPEAVEIEFEGALYEVPIALKDALLRQSDYTQKTQEVSAKTKEVEVLQGSLRLQEDQFKFAQQIQPDIVRAQQLEDTAIQTKQYLKDNLDSLSSTDIEKLRFAAEESLAERDKLISSLQGKQQEFQQAQQQSQSELLKQGTEVLKQRISNWGEDSAKQVRTYALDAGFTEQEIQSVVDPRQVEILWKASQFDSLQAGKAAAVRKVVSSPSIKAKASNPMPEATKNKLNLRKTLKNPKLSDKAKARAIQREMGERFG